MSELAWEMAAVTGGIVVLSALLAWSLLRTRLLAHALTATALVLSALTTAAMAATWMMLPPPPAARQPPTISYSQVTADLQSHKVTAVYVDTLDLAKGQVDGELVYLRLRDNGWVTGIVSQDYVDRLAAQVVGTRTHVLAAPPTKLQANWQSYDWGSATADGMIAMLWVFTALATSALVLYVYNGTRQRARQLREFEAELSLALSQDSGQVS